MAEPITICDQVFLQVILHERDARNRDDVAEFMLLFQTDSSASSHRERSPRCAAMRLYRRCRTACNTPPISNWWPGLSPSQRGYERG